MAIDPFMVGVARLRRQPGASIHCAVEGIFDPTGELDPTSPGESYVPEGEIVRFDGTLEAISGGVVATGHVTGRWRGQCRRCATAVGGPIDVVVKERCLEGVTSEDDEAYPLEGDLVDLGPVVRDAIVLGDLLIEAAASGQDFGEAALLTRYQRARRPDNLMMLAMTDGLDRLFSTNNPLVRLARDLGIAAVHRAPPLKRLFMRQAMGLG